MSAVMLTVFPSAAHAAARALFVYVQSERAELLRSPSMRSAVAAVVSKGERLRVHESTGRWHKVSRAGKFGWVSALVVAPNAPIDKASVFKASTVDISRESRRRSSAVTSAAAARGLTEDDRGRLSKDAKADFNALLRVESMRVSMEEVETFLAGRAD